MIVTCSKKERFSYNLFEDSHLLAAASVLSLFGAINPESTAPSDEFPVGNNPFVVSQFGSFILKCQQWCSYKEFWK